MMADCDKETEHDSHDGSEGSEVYAPNKNFGGAEPCEAGSVTFFIEQLDAVSQACINARQRRRTMSREALDIEVMTPGYRLMQMIKGNALAIDHVIERNNIKVTKATRGSPSLIAVLVGVDPESKAERVQCSSYAACLRLADLECVLVDDFPAWLKKKTIAECKRLAAKLNPRKSPKVERAAKPASKITHAAPEWPTPKGTGTRVIKLSLRSENEGAVEQPLELPEPVYDALLEAMTSPEAAAEFVEGLVQYLNGSGISADDPGQVVTAMRDELSEPDASPALETADA
jgi:hypothetical protein